MCGGECKYHGLGQEHRLAVGFLLLKVPVCHLDCSLSLVQCKIFASYEWSPFYGSRQERAEQMWEVCWQCHQCCCNSASKGDGVALFCEKMNGKCEVMRMLKRTARKRNTYVLWHAIWKHSGVLHCQRVLFRWYFRRVKVLTQWKRSTHFYSKAESSCELFGRKAGYQWCPGPKCYKATQLS